MARRDFNPQTERLLQILIRNGPQVIDSPTLRKCADTLIDWDLASYNASGKLERTR